MSIVNAMQIKLRVLFQLQEHYIHIHYTYTQHNYIVLTCN